MSLEIASDFDARRYHDIIIGMAQLVVRNIERAVKTKLQRRARKHGCSMEEEVRDILRSAVAAEKASEPLGTAIARLFSEVGLSEPINELRGQEPRPAVFRK